MLLGCACVASATSASHSSGALEAGEPALSFLTIDIEKVLVVADNATVHQSLPTNSSAAAHQLPNSSVGVDQATEMQRSQVPGGKSNSSGTSHATLPSGDDLVSSPQSSTARPSSPAQVSSLMRRESLAAKQVINAAAPPQAIGASVGASDFQGSAEQESNDRRRMFSVVPPPATIVYLNVFFVVFIIFTTWYRRQRQMQISKASAVTRSAEVMEQILERVKMPEVAQSPWAPSPPAPQAKLSVEFRSQ